MNEYDSDKMADVLAASDGLDADRPSRRRRRHPVQHLLGARKGAGARVPRPRPRARAEAARPDLIIGVGGCVASQEGAAIVRRAPYVDVVFGPQTLHRLPQLIRERRATGAPQVDIRFPEIEKFDHLPPPRVDGASAFVSIMEGCSKYCTFCVVPYTRGEEVSRPFDDVLTEIADLADQGVSEITLLGQNVNAYRGPLAGNDAVADFALLIETIAEFAGHRAHPLHDLAPEGDVGAADRGLRQGRTSSCRTSTCRCNPGSDRVLAAMKRGYTALEYKSIVRRLRAVRPDLSLTSDFIVGFPGETDADFEQTMRLVEDVNFDGAFSFAYSAAPGHAGRRLCRPGSRRRSSRRGSRGCRRCSTASTARTATAMIGTRQRVLVTGRAAKDRARARRAHRQQPRRQFRRRRGADRHATSTSRSPRRCPIRCAASSPRHDSRPGHDPCRADAAGRDAPGPSTLRRPLPAIAARSTRCQCASPSASPLTRRAVRACRRARCSRVCHGPARPSAPRPARRCRRRLAAAQARAAPLDSRARPPRAAAAAARPPRPRHTGPAEAVRRRHQGREGDPRPVPRLAEGRQGLARDRARAVRRPVLLLGQPEHRPRRELLLRRPDGRQPSRRRSARSARRCS